MQNINFNAAKYAASYGTAAQLPPLSLPEIAFCGRSNVGKSSLINRLCGRKKLARTGSMPGKTATVNFFEIGGIFLVDLPGFGFAKRENAERTRFSDLLEGYFESGRKISLTVILIDIRHPLSPLDSSMISFLRLNSLPFAVAFTKADKLSPNQRKEALSQLAESIGNMDAVSFAVTSAETGDGIEDLKEIIINALN